MKLEEEYDTEMAHSPDEEVSARMKDVAIDSN